MERRHPQGLSDRTASVFQRRRKRRMVLTTEAQKRAKTKYDRAKTIGLYLKLNIKTDADIIAKLGSVPAKQTYIKELIRRDMKFST